MSPRELVIVINWFKMFELSFVLTPPWLDYEITMIALRKLVFDFINMFFGNVFLLLSNFTS
jgi:hypothetical protein